MIRDTLPRALDNHPRSPCYDDLRFISNNAEYAAEAVAICNTCTFRACIPVLADILADRTAAQFLEGVWDGRYYSQNTTGKSKPGGRVA